MSLQFDNKTGKWGGFNEIAALSRHIGRKILVYTKESDHYSRIDMEFNKPNNKRPLCVILVGNSHYKALFPKYH